MTSAFETSVVVPAPREVVFAYFIDPELMLAWIGDHAILDARPGGEFTLDIEGIPVRGNYVEIEPPERIVVSWGHAGSETLPPASTRVEFTLSIAGSDRTIVAVEHSGLPDEYLPSHRAGWPMFLARLASVGHGRRVDT